MIKSLSSRFCCLCYSSVVFVLFVFLSCSFERPLLLNQLDFGNFEQAYIKDNNIARSILTYHSEEGLRTDTIEYDVLGRKIYETTGPDVVRMFYGPDGLILVRRFGRGPSFGIDSATYRYVPDSLILYQTWVASGKSKKYQFDDDGKIESAMSFEKERTSLLTDSSAYVYRNGHLHKIKYFTRSGDKMELRSKTLLHYSGSRLDSMIQVSPVQMDSKTIYDSRQLPIETHYGKKLFLEYRYESR